MAKKQINGQLDLFSYINSIQSPESYGDMEMVSLMPSEMDNLVINELNSSDSNLEEDIHLIKKAKMDELVHIDMVDLNDEPEMISEEPPVMAKYFVNQQGESVYIEYRNYNRVIIKMAGEDLQEYNCINSAEAVDMYVNKMYDLMDDKSLKEV